jgi:hypothetical protein
MKRYLFFDEQSKDTDGYKVYQGGDIKSVCETGYLDNSAHESGTEHHPEIDAGVVATHGNTP